jgi:small subunit ribosomal protein S17
MKSTPEVAPDLRSARKARVCVVVSDKMDKTRVVKDYWLTVHPRYGKVLRRTTKYYVHDEKNESKAGDRIEIMETRPMSRLKRWRMVRVVEKSK